MKEIAERLAEIGGVLAVTLGGSRVTGTAGEDSDWDFGLYYRGDLDVEAIGRLGWPGRVFRPGEWGRIINGGAWLTVDGVKVDLIYRDIDEVAYWTDEAEAGRFRVEREVGYVAGLATYTLAGELALGEVLIGQLPQPAFPQPLRSTAPAFWYQIGGGALRFAEVYARRGDRVACVANAAQAVLCAAQGRVAGQGQWALNEKRLVAAAELDEAQDALAEPVLGQLVGKISSILDLPGWG